MIEEQLISYVIDNTFAIAVAAFLLWKDYKQGQKTTEALAEVSITMKTIREFFMKEEC
jgi:hypothetical protein